MVEPVGRAAPRLVWSVGALLQAVADTLNARFAVCVVRGELSGFTRAGSGHCYFTLKDDEHGGGVIRCAMFRRAAGLLDFSPADGQLVELRGRVAVYEPRGELQFVVESMRRAGAGSLFEQFARLKAKLEAEGLFAAETKRPLPAYPRRIGVVTSLSAAALHDVLTSLARRAPHAEVVVYPTPVQGAEAPAGIVSALSAAAARREADVLIVCRGGGSMEDLWSFNDERVVRAIAASPIPVISGVGHETDITLADFAADLRAPTPTAAAELAVPARAECIGRLDALAGALQRRLRQRLDLHAQRLDGLSMRLCRPAQALGAQRLRLEAASRRLPAAVHREADRRSARLDAQATRWQRALPLWLTREGHRLDAIGGRLSALDPARVLQRGYAWLADDAGRPVLSAATLGVGETVRATLSDGEVRAEVREVIRPR